MDSEQWDEYLQAVFFASIVAMQCHPRNLAEYDVEAAADLADEAFATFRWRVRGQRGERVCNCGAGLPPGSRTIRGP